MIRLFPRRCIAGRLAVAVLTILAVSVACSSGDARIEASQARAADPVAGSSQIVITLTNVGERPDRLISASTPAAVDVQIHLTEIVEQRASMRSVDTVDLPTGTPVRFRPGGLHLMMVVPDETVVLGARFPLTLTFQHAAPITVDVDVVPLDELLEGS
ncbi:MAG: copper chaperone PCu(A)C [Nitriliruptoraceae bacterium]